MRIAGCFNKLIFILFALSPTAKIYTGQEVNDVARHPEQPDSGYIAIVTIVVATLLVLVLTVVSHSRLESFNSVLLAHSWDSTVLFYLKGILASGSFP